MDSVNSVQLDKIKRLYFLGAGGIGMSALARYFHHQGKIVSGYDRTPSLLTEQLISEGLAIHFVDEVSAIPGNVRNNPPEETLVVYTPAVPKDNRQLQFFQSHGFEVIKRSQLLGRITENSRTIAVAGTHGKTTTSSLIAHILVSSGHGCNAFLGGITANYETNLLLSSKEDAWTVVEADEFDRSFLTLSPDMAVITSMDADHLDIYGTHQEMVDSFQLFVGRIRENGILLYRNGLTLSPIGNSVKHYAYSASLPSNYSAEDIRITEGKYQFDLVIQKPGEIPIALRGLTVGLPGRHNVENAVAASAIALEVGVNTTDLRTALATFKGVKRRFEYVIDRPNLAMIDDYAHHPAELEATIRSVREMYPGRHILGIFQPHLFSRTRDFADEFGKSLGLLDEVILLPIYPARELPIPGIDSQMLLDKIPLTSKKVLEKSGLLDELMHRRLDVVLTLGAGDIDTLVLPIKNMLAEFD